MAIELKVPNLGESIVEVEIGSWLKAPGARVERDEPLVSLESDKTTVELPAPAAGTITQIVKKPGETAQVGEVIGYMEEGAAGTAPAAPKAEAKAEAAPKVEAKPEAQEPPRNALKGATRIMPAAQRALSEYGLGTAEVEATGPGGRLLKEDVLRTAERKAERARESGGTPKPAAPQAPRATISGGRQEEAVRMTPMRRRIAARLLEAQHNAALLTTFNEVDLSAVMALRTKFKDSFQEKHKAKLGFMSFFVKAAIEALKTYPQLNAQLRGEDIVYHNYHDIGIAVGAGKGLVVPVLRNAETMSFAEIEKRIADFGQRASANKIELDELQGGTFTITNGGIYGSLLSTPIVNPPQSGILGMHAIQERPVAVNGQVVIRPMMYIALTYDHRIVDGREAVLFLKRIKECLEDPTRIILEI